MYENLSFNYGTGSYAIYLRKSRRDLDAEALGEGETLERHFHILKDLALHRRLNITKVYAEIVSGESIETRPMMQQLLKAVEANSYDGVLVAEVERLARGDTSDQGRVAKTFKFSNTLIITPERTYDPNNEFDEEYFEFGLFMSRREYKAIRRRLTAGTNASCREGKYTGNIAPYGYERYKLKNEKGWSLKILPDQASVVRMIFSWYQKGLNAESVGYGKIARELNRLAIPSPSGCSWSPYSVQNILRNPVYAGYIKCGYRKEIQHMAEGRLIKSRPLNPDCRLYPGRHEAIISKKEWEEVRFYMEKRRASSSGSCRSQQNPLAGLIRCSICHRVMQRRPLRGASEALLICTSGNCPTVSSSLSLVEQRIIEALTLWLSPCQLPIPDPSPDSEKLMLLKSRLEGCQNALLEVSSQIERQYDLLERGIYTENIFLERSRAAQKKKDALAAELQNLYQELEEEKQNFSFFQKNIAAPDSLKNAYDQIENPSSKNLFLKEFIDRAEYTKSSGGRWNDPDRFTLKIYPKLR